MIRILKVLILSSSGVAKIRKEPGSLSSRAEDDRMIGAIPEVAQLFMCGTNTWDHVFCIGFHQGERDFFKKSRGVDKHS